MKTSSSWRIEHYSILPSTNDYCIERAKAGCNDRLAVIANQQTAARGSRGRSWTEPEGHLALSIMIKPTSTFIQSFYWPFIASLAFYDGVCKTIGNNEKLCIKWPNDLLGNQKKLGGILIESQIQYPNLIEWIVIGFGLNIKNKPVSLDRPVSCLADITGFLPKPVVFAKFILESFSYWEDIAIQKGFPNIRNAWMQRSFPIGTAMTVSLHGKKIDGLYQGINQEGILLLQTKNGLEKIAIGEIFL